jgi:hypothetical protein
MTLAQIADRNARGDGFQIADGLAAFVALDKAFQRAAKRSGLVVAPYTPSGSVTSRWAVVAATQADLHPMVPSNAFPTAKAATSAAFRVYESTGDKATLAGAVLPPKVVTVTTEETRERFAVPPLRFAVPPLRVHDGTEADAAEIESAEHARRALHANIGS